MANAPNANQREINKEMEKILKVLKSTDFEKSAIAKHILLEAKQEECADFAHLDYEAYPFLPDRIWILPKQCLADHWDYPSNKWYQKYNPMHPDEAPAVPKPDGLGQCFARFVVYFGLFSEDFHPDAQIDPKDPKFAHFFK